MSDPIPLRDAVAAVGRDLGLADTDLVGRLIAAWPGIVGRTVAAHAALWSVRDGVVTVAVDEPAYATGLRYREADLLEALRGPAGTSSLRAVHVVVVAPGKSLR